MDDWFGHVRVLVDTQLSVRGGPLSMLAGRTLCHIHTLCMATKIANLQFRSYVAGFHTGFFAREGKPADRHNEGGSGGILPWENLKKRCSVVHSGRF